jgi:hypothetical protein
MTERFIHRCSTIIISLSFLTCRLAAQPSYGTKSFISNDFGPFSIHSDGKTAPMIIGSEEWPGVIRAFKDLQSDIYLVTSSKPELYSDKIPKSREIIIAGTIGKSRLIDELIQKNKIDVSDIKGKWETFAIQVVNKPFKGVRKALIIIGSDKRGTIYGIYELSKQIGVSPWYWWADVHPDKKNNVYFKSDIRYVDGPPSVKYRGIFLNDEAPDLTNWIRFKYGDVLPKADPPIPPGVANYGQDFYTRLFELMLRLKANYLWPAMWNNAFNEDDPENPRLADEYGIVMGNSHQEPMLRAQKEWDRRYIRTIGTWNYAQHPDILGKFWREGIRRNRNFESIITIGLRGANDTPMAPGGPEENMSLLERIVDVQRKIIAEEMNTDATKVPQLWCLYKEVQDFYKAGMRVPDDVTLLWAEDNWGNIRRLPTAEERERSGGAGIYYHFDYHGGPRSYQWINTNPISKIWDQMSLAKQYGADKIWIVNVGHFKGYEFPMEYFLDLAWNTERLDNESITDYTKHWAAREFGGNYSEETAEIMSRYTKYNGRRKPELLSPSTYSLVNYNEAEKVVDDFKTITVKAEEIFNKLPSEKRDAFYQLILFPTKASAIVNELYLSAARNDLYFKQGRASTNEWSDQVQKLFRADTSLMGYYNRLFAGGKWNHFMDQSHLGYTSWADPPFNSLRALSLKTVSPLDSSSMGIAIEGSESVWPDETSEAILPQIDNFNRQSRYIEVFNKGLNPFEFSISADKPWILTSSKVDSIYFFLDKRITISVDWDLVPSGKTEGIVKITGTGKTVDVRLDIFNPDEIRPGSVTGFAEGEGYVSMEAEHFTGITNAGDLRWIKIEDYGHTLSAMRAAAPVDAPSAVPGINAPCLEYKMYLFNSGEIEVTSIFAPTLNFVPGRGLQYAVSIDDQPPQTVTLVPPDYNAQNRNAEWERTVSDNARFSRIKLMISSKGYHTLKIWMVDPGVVIQKIIVDTGGLKPSYLGPPESYFRSVIK